MLYIEIVQFFSIKRALSCILMPTVFLIRGIIANKSFFQQTCDKVVQMSFHNCFSYLTYDNNTDMCSLMLPVNQFDLI